MTVTWERFAGNTEVFAVRMSFMPDPDDGYGATQEESASWGALQLWVGGHNLCAHTDQGEVLQGAHWYLLPLLEWVIMNWNPLLHEERLPNTNSAESAVAALSMWRNAPPLAGEAESLTWEQAAYDWWSRHTLRSARSGGLVPNVFIRRLRDLVEVSWNDDPAAGTPRGFTYSATSGRMLLDPEAVAIPLHEVVSAAIGHLSSLPAAGSRIDRLRAMLHDLEVVPQRDIRLDWLAGLVGHHPRGIASEHVSELTPDGQVRWSEIVAALQDVGDEAAVREAIAVDSTSLVIKGSCHATLLFSSLSPTVTESDVRVFAELLVGTYRPEMARTGLYEYVTNIQVDVRVPPWEQGYDLAESLHAELQLDFRDGWVDIAGLLRDLGVQVLAKELDDHAVRACSIVGPHHIPTIVQNTRSSFYESSDAQRFDLAHEMCHLLYDRSHGQKLAMASGPWAPVAVEQRAKAFAAMFLMPTELVAQVVADAPTLITELSGVDAAARRLRTSRRATIEHLYNLTFMTEADREELLKRL